MLHWKMSGEIANFSNALPCSGLACNNEHFVVLRRHPRKLEFFVELVERRSSHTEIKLQNTPPNALDIEDAVRPEYFTVGCYEVTPKNAGRICEIADHYFIDSLIYMNRLTKQLPSAYIALRVMHAVGIMMHFPSFQNTSLRRSHANNSTIIRKNRDL